MQIELVFFGDSITNGIVMKDGLQYYQQKFRTEVFGIQGTDDASVQRRMCLN